MIDTRDLELIRHVVKAAAADELLTRFERVCADTKTDGSLITEADLAMQNRLERDLAARWPAWAFLGEEMTADQQQRLLSTPHRPLWCVDPLDGTSNYAAGIPFFAVSVALLADGETRAAVVYDPSRDECFSALRGRGAWLNGRPLTAPDRPQPLAGSIAMVDLKRLPAALIRSLARATPYRSQRSFGSVALDWCWVAAGRCQVYLHGGQKLWDYAAGQLILDESGAVGGLLGDYAGDWLHGLSLAPRIAMAATHPELLGQWRSWVVAAFEG